jgi:hypothetical protein
MLKIKSTKLKNIKTGEVWFCENINEVRLIDGIEFVSVKKLPESRSFFIRLDQLSKIK